MKYYTIQNNAILTSENEQSLTAFYDNVKPLPTDYEPNKYIVENGELVLNPNWETEQEQKERELRIAWIKNKLSELDLKSIRPARAGETERLAELEAQAIELRKELQELKPTVKDIIALSQEYELQDEIAEVQTLKQVQGDSEEVE